MIETQIKFKKRESSSVTLQRLIFKTGLIRYQLTIDYDSGIKSDVLDYRTREEALKDFDYFAVQ
ncbi:MAG: hypothetical protein COT46_00175 [Sulfurimonas sp. CG08_land_8_20_14_0_20_36_33]|nr:hypothetical protein [Campylobacterota bacterium]OIO16912.1 MAG: hypothetical protein AUJ81_03205 [Helicobacteraceae bacterium CG1_02_36_14]PIP09368.1 MAG: hypothetical protein COX50_11355 [Sulfurimonas sp. CG23_combo_of_CG06-09_8_20_14_all_36_33]PIS27062.1 MAG: hypothetical protein COT46_00175 [Sulfurimonas sp. CG08_land_8_20_14_0_20_36_33]PIV05779.1 MAG: hypothetical protein COS56_00240 [Sulfurimonas sp. CG03_land_8_20_14_0_80_36_25]PIV61155.1 MAG: hypothetical protein COS13_03480 [Sulfur